ncbi:MAG TPA: hypothetical protein VJO52_05490 [Gemmatimonadaceae bacterium]|nr:hypothetical protein [Gemmatimonadaceae bacterium]
MLRNKMRTLVLSAVLIATSASCFSDMGPTGIATPEVPKTNASLNLPILTPVLGSVGRLVGTLLQCTPQPFAADTEVVGRAGGVIRMGRHQLVIPAGALASPVRIIGSAPVDHVVSVEFQPEGLQFNPQHLPELTLDYSACPLVPVLLPKRIAYTDEKLNILSYLLSIDNLLQRRVSGRVHHFSRYAVAW